MYYSVILDLSSGYTAGTITNTATVMPPIGRKDQNLLDNTSTVQSEPIGLYDLGVVKSVEYFNPDSIVTYRIKAYNNLPRLTEDFILTDSVPLNVLSSNMYWKLDSITSTTQNITTSKKVSGTWIEGQLIDTVTFRKAGGINSDTIYYSVFIKNLNNYSKDTLKNIVRVIPPINTIDENMSDNISSVLNVFPTPTPLHLIKFTAQEKECKKVELYWKTVKENMTKEFQIQKSIDGKSFQYLSSVQASKFSNISEYSIVLDQKSIKSFYRLKMIDIDGNYTYGPIKTVNLSCLETPIEVFPNPTINNIYISNLEVNQQLKVYDLLGNVLIEKTTAQGLNSLDVSSLPVGRFEIIIFDKSKVIFTHNFTKVK